MTSTTTTTVAVEVGVPPVPPGSDPDAEVAVGAPPVPPTTDPEGNAVAVGVPPVPPAPPTTRPSRPGSTPLWNLHARPVVEVTSTGVVDDAVDDVADRLGRLTSLL